MAKLTPYQQFLVTDNINFAYWLLHKLSRTYAIIEKDELESIIMESFVQAAARFDPSKGCDYIYFAKIHAKNKILDEIAKRRVRIKYNLDTHYQAKFDPDVPAPEINIDLHQAINEILDRNKYILIDYYFNGLSQPEIALKYNLSRPSISDILKQCRETIKAKIA